MMAEQFQSLIRTLSSIRDQSNVIDWSSPVPFFGDCARASLATVGINPSNREFVCAKGAELDESERRFHTLQSLGIRRWEDADETHARMIERACVNYFSTNPYDSWFRRIDQIIAGTGCSYYNTRACHIDLVPFATSRKWATLGHRERENLLLASSEEMKSIIAASNIRVLILNGATVVDRMSSLYKIEWEVELKDDWNLARKSGYDVQGKSFRTILKIERGRMSRDILVLGFNHNIQSSFGVTSRVINSIRDWITTSAKEQACGKII